MKFETRFEVLQLADLVTPPYNPRISLEPGSPKYEALRRSIEQYELVEPPVVNLYNMRCIGGNQRVAVMLALGWKETLCSVIDQPDENKEKKLCLALNRIDGRWDSDKLGELLNDSDILEYETGFDEDELRLYRQLEDVCEPDFTDNDDNLEGESCEIPMDNEPEDEQPAPSVTIVKIGSLHFKMEVQFYHRLIQSIRDTGIFDQQGTAQEIKRRLLCHD